MITFICCKSEVHYPTVGNITCCPECKSLFALQCQWFAGCRNEATSEVSHPVLGMAPVCDGCAEWIRSVPRRLLKSS